MPHRDDEMVSIEGNKAIPDADVGRRRRYPWKEMKVGDSFFSKAKGFETLASRANRVYFPRKWTWRTVTEEGVKGIRAWRVL
jgi:hypothetical protein